MARSLLVTTQYNEQASVEGKQGYRLRVQIEDPTEMSAAIFRYRVRPLREGEVIPLADFEGICTPAEMESLATDEPPDDLDPPRFRIDYCDLIVASRTLQRAALEAIQADVQGLIDALNALDAMEEISSIVIS